MNYKVVVAYLTAFVVLLIAGSTVLKEPWSIAGVSMPIAYWTAIGVSVFGYFRARESPEPEA